MKQMGAEERWGDRVQSGCGSLALGIVFVCVCVGACVVFRKSGITERSHDLGHTVQASVRTTDYFLSFSRADNKEALARSLPGVFGVPCFSQRGIFPAHANWRDRVVLKGRPGGHVRML